MASHQPRRSGRARIRRPPFLALALVAGLAGLVALPASAQTLARLPPPVALSCADRFDTAPRPGAGPLTVTFHGVSTLMFSDGRDRLLIDGFFSRPALGQLLFAPLVPDRDRVERGLGAGPPVRAVLVAHAHHDHAMDVSTVAQFEPGAIIVGTPSVQRMVHDQGIAPQRSCVPDGAPFTFGAYRVWAVEAPHGPSPWPLPLILDHPLTRSLATPAWFGAYKDNRNLSFIIQHEGLRILVHPSAGRKDLRTRAVDVAFIGLARVGRLSGEDAEAYFSDVIGPRTHTVFPIHWDQFTTPPGTPLRPLPPPLDNVPEGLRRLCVFAADHPRRPKVIRLQAGASVLLSSAPPRSSPDEAQCAAGSEARAPASTSLIG